jgi:cullin-associated NEDD8-dissociated protein 1
VKCLGAVIRSRGDLLDSLYKNVAPLLIIRLREREELVKMDVFSAFKDLLRQSQHHGPITDDPMEQDSAGLERHPSLSLVELLDVDKVMKAVSKQLKDKSFKTKERCFEMLRELLLVLNGGLSAHLASLIPHLEKSIERSKNAKPSLRIEALLFLSLLLEKHADADFSQYVKRLGNSILECVADSNYKISSVALRVCARLATCSRGGVRLLKAGDPFVESMYSAAVSRLSSQDQDLEVKESAISTMGHLIASLGDILGQGKLETCLPILLERLRNETTRITALKAFALIAVSPLKVSLNCVLHDAVLVCADFLRKNDRALKQAALTTLKAFVDNCSPSLGPDLFESVTKELCMLVSETELHLTHLALQLCVSMVQNAPSTTELVQRYILPRAMLLLQSPLLQVVCVQLPR